MGYHVTENKTFTSVCTWTNTYFHKILTGQWSNSGRNKVYHGHYFDPKPPYGWQGALSFRRQHLGVISFVGAFSRYRNDIGKNIKSGRLWLRVDHAFLHAGGMRNVVIRGFKYGNWSAPSNADISCIDYDIRIHRATLVEGYSYYIDLDSTTLSKIKNGQIHGFVLWSDDPFCYRVRVNASKLNVRSGPGTNHSVIGSTTRGAVHMSWERAYGWHKISYNGGFGWVSGSYLDYIKSTVEADNHKYGYLYGSHDGSNAPLIELTYENVRYVETPCHGYGATSCSCNSRCYGNSSSCSCYNKTYNTCSCNGRCYEYKTTCSCNQRQHGSIPCSCNSRCHTEGNICPCYNKAYNQYYTCESCYSRCDGYEGCSTCDGCNSYQTCSCNGPCDRDSCDRCHHKNYGLYTEDCSRNIIEYPALNWD